MAVSFQLRHAIDSRDFEAARRLAVAEQEVALKDALDLTLLAADSEPDLYEPMARSWLARLALEREPQPTELESAARLLAGVGDRSIPAVEAAAALERTVSGSAS